MADIRIPTLFCNEGAPFHNSVSNDVTFYDNDVSFATHTVQHSYTYN